MAEVVGYSHLTRATVPERSWDGTWFALQTLKGYLQSFPGHIMTRISARPVANGEVRVIVSIHWQHPEQLEAWRESDLSIARMFQTIEPAPHDIEEETLEDFS